ncbi:MAG TPA: hypothetical protein VEL47_01355, partial [Myxococcota bacterium]|nr:hypothetical protein [Myxococcota bacterium]
FLNQGRILSGVIMPLFYNDLGTAKRIFSENMAILGDLSQGAVRPNFLDSSWSITRDKIARSGDVTIADSARLMGPLIIARGARIGALARLGPNVVIGERAIIGEGAKLTNTVIMSDTVIGKDERLNCTIGLGSARVFVKPS